MNVILYSALAVVGTVAWWRSGVPIFRLWFWMGFGIVFLLWWVLWGHVAVADGWWIYTGEGSAYGHNSLVTIFDGIYFLGCGGWYFYFLRKLEVF